MGVLKFVQANPTPRLRFETVATSVGNLPTDAWTFAILAKRLGTGSSDPFSYIVNNDNIPWAGLSIDTNDNPNVDVGAGSHATGSSLTSTTSPYLMVVSKTAGTTAPTISWKLGSGGAWTDETHGTALPNMVAGDGPPCEWLEIGAWAAEASGMNGWIGVVGIWSGAMSTANKKLLDDNWRTSDWWNSAHGHPVFLMELNVAVVALVDLAANVSNQTSATLPTLDATETLDSWNFNGIGGKAGSGVMGG
jgi:hypothetical protein